ncbi:MAG: Sec-independent protein translocase subunit TatA [Candidatus Nanopelagicales bacterium]|jgi:sec-independent protein translocase protein TatA
MPFNLRGPEILILVLIILLLFGAKRLPDVARGMGRSLRIFKAETKELSADDAADVVDDAPPASSTTPPTSLPPAPAESTPAPPQAERTES